MHLRMAWGEPRHFQCDHVSKDFIERACLKAERLKLHKRAVAFDSAAFERSKQLPANAAATLALVDPKPPSGAKM